ncbi:DinB family protein [Deinococcus oregonensis]|uniref:DinB family protein n=1 Tax=Deinococcus oregonensis TaxID=1805970 RepID=A0ABV6B4L1_9DEIO
MQTPELLCQAWTRNMAANTALLDVISPQALTAAVPSGAPIGQHLQHIALDVCHWLAHLNAARADKLRAALPLWNGEGSDAAFLRCVREVWLGAERSLLDEVLLGGHDGQLPHAAPELLPVHMLVHDAFHRGQIVAALRAHGYPAPDVETFWGPWRS